MLVINNIGLDNHSNLAFSIDSDRLLVNDSDDLDYETNPILNITIEVSDGELIDEATVTLNLSDVKELSIIEDEGTATFAKYEDGTYLIIDGDKELQLQNPQGQNYSDNTTPNWDGIAVELGSADSYRVLLQGQNTKSGQAYVWTTNSEGVINRGFAWKSGDTLLSWEGKFNIDLNNDQLIGSPVTIIEDEGIATFAKYGDGTYLIIDGDKKLQLQNSNGQNYSDQTTANWDGVAVELGSADSYRVLLQGQNTRSGQAYIWTTNSKGVVTSGSRWKSGDALSSIEEEFNIDLNNDQLIGSSSTII